jgi:hypothetical protein
MAVTTTDCPLCADANATRILSANDRDFWRCAVCQLIFVPRAHHLSLDAELARYQTHQNDPNNAGYRVFLNRLLQHLTPRLPVGAHGLDYGSGPGPAISVMLAERGFHVTNYDPFFAPRVEALQRDYDFITCTETVEHFARPAEEFARFDGLLRSGGWLGVMTQMLESDGAFENWWYHRDPTHICFYRAATMEWIARRHGWRCEFPAPNVALFFRP